MIKIATINDIHWYLNSESGKLLGYDSPGYGHGIPKYEFWIGNPPAEHTSLFTAVCDLAVAMGTLRRVPMYAVVRE